MAALANDIAGRVRADGVNAIRRGDNLRQSHCKSAHCLLPYAVQNGSRTDFDAVTGHQSAV